jgi:hypothetical protein
MKALATTAVALSIAAVSRATPAEDMAALVKSWVGRPVMELVRIWGEGEQSATRVRTTLYRYFGEGGRPGINTAGFNAVRGGRTGCSVTFEVDRRGIVTDATWSTDGASDRKRARRVCWREFKGNEPPE